MAISNAEEVELKLNGKIIGRKKNNAADFLEWMVPYQPCKLEAVGFKSSKQNSHYAVETTSSPVCLKLTAYKNQLKNNGKDATPITVEALDAQGRHVPNANMQVKFTVNNSAQIIGVGNGNPNSHEPEKGDRQHLFNGLAHIIVQTLKQANQPVKITAEAEGLKQADLQIELIAAKPALSIAAQQPELLLNQWSVSPEFSNRPDPNMVLAGNDMNS